MIHTMLAHTSVPTSFWHHVLQMATYLLNILPHKTFQNQLSMQLLYHRDPTCTYMRVFFCLCYPLFFPSNIHKLQPRSTLYDLLGYTLNHRGYKCFDLSNLKLITLRNVIFDDTQFHFTEIHFHSLHSYNFLNDDLHPYIAHQWKNHMLPPVANDQKTLATTTNHPHH